jgi:hypothetical protein
MWQNNFLTYPATLLLLKKKNGTVAGGGKRW